MNPKVWSKEMLQSETRSYNSDFNGYPTVADSELFFELPAKINNSISLFMVYKSDGSLVNSRISTVENQLEIKNNKVVSNSQISFKEDESLPNILMYKGKIETRKGFDGNLILRTDEEGICWIDLFRPTAEILMFDRILSESESQRIHSYLSIKYGISLPKDSDYLSSTEVVLLNGSDMGDHYYRISGIGKDSGYGLNQKTSQNSRDNNRCKVTLDASSTFKDQQYLLWGDNGKEFSFENSDDSDLLLCNRSWRFKNISERSNSTFSFSIEHDNDLIDNEYDYFFVWGSPKDRVQDLILNQLTSAKLIDDGLYSEKLSFEGFDFDELPILYLIGKKKQDFINSSDLRLSSPSLAIANQAFQVKLESSASLKGNITIYTTSGDKIIEESVPDTKFHSADLSLPYSGYYLIVYSNESTEVSKSIIIQ